MAAEPERKTVCLRIFGRVQGVGYRAWAARRAGRLGLTGWVRNLSDGTVECLVQGPREAIETMLTACHAGPALARVTAIDSAEVPSAEIYPSFQQRSTEGSPG